MILIEVKPWNTMGRSFFLLEGTPQHVQTLYRGQQMAASELIQLQKCVGGTIAMPSFVSTTKNLDVAKLFAGNGEERPARESVMFEIFIDECENDYERSPFADISAISAKRGEAEVLLCLGTTLRVESVKVKEQLTWIRVRMSQREENEEWRQLASGFDTLMDEDFVLSECVALLKLSVVLYFTNDDRKMEQLVKALCSSTCEPADPLISLLYECMSLLVQIPARPSSEFDLKRRLSMNYKRVQEHLQPLLDSPSMNGRARDLFLKAKTLNDGFIQRIRSNADPLICIGHLLEGVDTHPALKEHPALELIIKILPPSFEVLNRSNQSSIMMSDNILQAYYDRVFPEKGYDRASWYLQLAEVAEEQGNDEEAIRLLREGLSVPCSERHSSINLYLCLQLIYTRQKNWFAVIECCQAIINMPQLFPNSPRIVNAYINCGWACRALKDYSEALIYYATALELQHQHHLPRHPLTTEVYVEMGILFFEVGDADTAVEYFQIAITLDLPESRSKAHEWMAHTYKRTKQYDEARSHLLQCLDIRQRHSPSKGVQLVKTYLLLIEIEHITGNHQQRDVYLQHAQRVANSSEEANELLLKRTRQIVDMPSPATL